MAEELKIIDRTEDAGVTRSASGTKKKTAASSTKKKTAATTAKKKTASSAAKKKTSSTTAKKKTSSSTAKKKTSTSSSTIKLSAAEKKLVANYRKCDDVTKKLITALTEKAADGNLDKITSMLSGLLG